MLVGLPLGTTSHIKKNKLAFEGLNPVRTLNCSLAEYDCVYSGK